MACPGGCAGGGGQPIVDGVEMAEYRGGALWELDKGERVRFSHENNDVQALYRDYLEKPCGQRSHHPAPHRPPRLADAAGSAEGNVKPHRELANVLPPRVRPEGKGMEAVFPGPERPENAHAFSAWAFSTVKKDGLRPGKGETMEKRIALVAIVVEAPGFGGAAQRHSPRLPGAHHRPHGAALPPGGLSLISVAVCAPGDVISALSGKLGMLPGVSAKTAYAKTVTE